jgi:stearoyl-CoA desaturase (delta-9 desaturase)
MKSLDLSKIEWPAAAFIVGAPASLLILVPWFLAVRGWEWSYLWATLGLIWFVGLGITMGYHRMYAHGSWKGALPIRVMMLIGGAGAMVGSVVTWAASHRYHHKFENTDQDPINIRRGFWYSHILHAMQRGPKDGDLDIVKDLLRDPLCRWQHRYYWLIVACFNLGVPFLLGLASGQMLGMFLFAGLARMVILHHGISTINSIAHTWGSQPWDAKTTARDNPLLGLAIVGMGENYHNFHHAFPHDYRLGVRWYDVDLGKWCIWFLSKVGLAWGLQRTTRRRMEGVVRSRSMP